MEIINLCTIIAFFSLRVKKIILFNENSIYLLSVELNNFEFIVLIYSQVAIFNILI
jgi:hypothetical protein